MQSHRRNSLGVSLLEVMLVLAVAGSILIMGFKQYQIFLRDAQVHQLQYNVDVYFQALAQYFRAHCNRGPFNTNFPDVYMTVSSDELKQEGYLSQAITPNPLVNETGEGKGYILQLNQIQPLPRRTIPMGEQTEDAVIGSQAVWRAQVAVEIKDADNVATYKELLGADCAADASSAHGQTYVASCSMTPPAKPKYIVWERMPSYASSQYNSVNWITMPTVKQFTQMYTTMPILELTGNKDSADQQYYFCGS
jgi:type II secretory pathway pseudopilin PulG